MLGYDSILPQDHPNDDGSIPDDDEIIRICLSTNRILISKDYEIIKKMKMKTEKNLKLDPQFLIRYGINWSLGEDGTISVNPYLLLRSTDITLNLSEIYQKFKIHLEYNIENARCPKCNATLQKVQDPSEYKDRIPPSVYKYHNYFWKCSNSTCSQLFWKGTHIERIIQTLKSIQKINKKY